MFGEYSISENELFPNKEKNTKLIVYWNENVKGHFLFNQYNIENNAPSYSGIYFLYWDYGKLLYIGETLNIRNRLLQHFKGISNTKEIKDSFHLFQYIPVSVDKLKEYEFFYINYVKPKLNVGSVVTYNTQRYKEEYNKDVYYDNLIDNLNNFNWNINKEKLDIIAKTLGLKRKQIISKRLNDTFVPRHD